MLRREASVLRSSPESLPAAQGPEQETPGGKNQPLPFTNGVNILQAPSLRAPGTTNLLIREGAVPGKQIQ
jgi:hypothetical protein